MAYVLDITRQARTDGVLAASVTFSEWFAASDLVAGDYIMVAAINAGGVATPLTITSSVGTWTRLDNTNAPRIGANFSAQIWWTKYDGVTLPTAPTIGGGAVNRWAVAAFVIRDAPDVADQSWINVTARSDPPTAARTFTIPSVTTTAPDCLLVQVMAFGNSGTAFESPDPFWGVDLNVARVGDDAGTTQPQVKMMISTRAAPTAGATPTYQMVHGGTSNRAQLWTIAVRNKTGGARPFGVANPPTKIFDYFADGNFGLSSLTQLSFVRSTIAGWPVVNLSSITTSITPGNAAPLIENWFRTITLNPPGVGNVVYGVRWDLPAPANLTTGLWCLFLQRAFFTQDDPLGLLHYFEDAAGNWSVYRFATRTESVPFITLVRHLPDEVRVDGSTTPPDLSAITRRGIAYRQTGAFTAGRIFNLRAECIQPFATPLTLTGGGPTNPITARTVAAMLASGAAWNLALAQGQGQQVVALPFQLGDGSAVTYIDNEAQSLEYPRPGGVGGYAVAANRQTIRVRAGASDTIRLDAGITGTATVQDFVIDPASSTAATYGFAGTFLGWNVTARTGVPMVGATFARCRKIDGKGSSFDNCIIKTSVATDAALRLADGGSAVGASFTKGSETYAVEVFGTGTVDLSNATYSGYAKPINVLATSGTVTILLAAGQATPTFDTAGATVVFDQPQVTATVTCIDAATSLPISGVRVLVRTDANVTVISGTTNASGQISAVWAGGTPVNVSGWARKASGPPNYIEGRIAGTISSAGFSSTLLLQSEG
jgi:hypothetical protein